MLEKYCKFSKWIQPNLIIKIGVRVLVIDPPMACVMLLKITVITVALFESVISSGMDEVEGV